MTHISKTISKEVYERLTDTQQTQGSVQDGSLRPKNRGGNVDIDGKTTTLGGTNGLKDTFPSLDTTFQFARPRLLEERSFDRDEML